MRVNQLRQEMPTDATTSGCKGYEEYAFTKSPSFSRQKY